MPPKRRKLQRELGNRPYRRIFVIVTEGEKTEPRYFSILGRLQTAVAIRCVNSRGGRAPLDMLKEMKRQLQQLPLKNTDEAWLVVDRDEWQEEHLSLLSDWAEKWTNYGLALSNPKFEYWLLLHFEDGNDVRTPSDCDTRLRQHIPAYDKEMPDNLITLDRIKGAIKRARQRDVPAALDWPKNPGATTVYRLVENILK